MYKSTFIALAALAALSCPSVSAQEYEQDTLVTEAVMPLLRALVADVGGEVLQESTDSVQLEYMAENGLRFNLSGTACEGEGILASCKGLFMNGRWSADGEPFSLEALNSFDNQYAAVNVSLDSNGSAMISRYLILDHGQTFRNLALNLRVTETIGNSFNEAGLE